jgi:hypothetical protein
MIDMEIGLIWLLAAVLAAAAVRLAETQSARLFGFAPSSRFMDAAPMPLLDNSGRPPGAGLPTHTNAGPPAVFRLLT